MNYSDFEIIISHKRMKRYLVSCGGNKRKAQMLYRLNLRLSQQMFTVISYYEVALRIRGRENGHFREKHSQ